MKNYRAISGKLLSRTRSAVTRVVSVDETIMAATVEEVYFEVNSSFYFREKIIEQYFTILLRHMALLISAVNLEMAVSI